MAAALPSRFFKGIGSLQAVRSSRLVSFSQKLFLRCSINQSIFSFPILNHLRNRFFGFWICAVSFTRLDNTRIWCSYTALLNSVRRWFDGLMVCFVLFAGICISLPKWDDEILLYSAQWFRHTWWFQACTKSPFRFYGLAQGYRWECKSKLSWFEVDVFCLVDLSASCLSFFLSFGFL